MPTYEYCCSACKKTVEVFHSMTKAPRRKCPHCGRLTLQKLIGIGAGVIFKGSGFYQTDYRGKSYAEAAKKDKPTDAPAASPASPASAATTSPAPSSDSGKAKDKTKSAATKKDS